MLRTLIRKEILSHVLSLRFAVTFLLFIGLISASFFVTTHEYILDRDQAVAIAHNDREYFAAMKDLPEAWERYYRIFRTDGRTDPVPVPRLMWAGHGLQAALPQAINTRARKTSIDIPRTAARNPMLGLLRVPDFIYVVNVILSLLAMLFMFDAVCGEKEAGTLRLILTNAVPRSAVLIGKWVGGYLVLMAPFLIAVFGGLIYALYKQVLTPDSEAMSRLGLLVLVAGLYIAVFYNISLFISCLTTRSTTALLICLLVWVLFILAIPNLAPVTARALAPTPSQAKIEQEKAAIDREYEMRIARVSQGGGALDYGESANEEEERLEKEREDRKKRFDEFFKQQRTRQISLAQTLGRLSPSGCWNYAAIVLTGTGLANATELEKVRRELATAFEKMHRQERSKGRHRGRREVDPNFMNFTYDDMPVLNMKSPDLKSDLEVALLDILVLAILNVIFFLLAFAFFLRYDVR